MHFLKTKFIKIYRSIKYNLHHGGIPRIYRKIFKSFINLLYFHDRILIYEFDLRRPPIQPVITLVTQKLLFSDLQAINYLKARFFPESIKNRFSKGEECYGFYINNELSHIVWVNHNYLRINDNFKSIPITNGVGIYDAITFSEFRKRGIFRSVLSYLQMRFKEQGKGKLLIAVAPDNLASIKAIKNAMFEPLYDFAFYRIFFIFKQSILKKIAD
jgi:hypothetical protein